MRFNRLIRTLFVILALAMVSKPLASLVNFHQYRIWGFHLIESDHPALTQKDEDYAGFFKQSASLQSTHPFDIAPLTEAILLPRPLTHSIRIANGIDALFSSSQFLYVAPHRGPPAFV